MMTNPSSTSADETPLPKGWEMDTTPSGRPYFIDHNRHLTTWADPRSPSTSEDHVNDADTNDCQRVTIVAQGPLGSKWEVKESRAGIVYFVDHETRKTTWKDPRFIEVEDTD
jgi:E3 ubiquitin-protein ligase NEDD4